MAVFFLLWLASLLASSSASAPGFDHFVLALQWPGTVCRSSAAGPCCRSDWIGWFTIHGLWPSYAQGNGPTCCNSPDFDMAKACSYVHRLMRSQSSCDACRGLMGIHGPSTLFRQWEKHGTWSYPVIQGEYSYFSTTLNLYSSYNVTAMLSSMVSIGADDGGRYLVTDLVATITSSFGASPLLIYERGSLQELRLCFNKDLKPLDCIRGHRNEYDIIERHWCRPCPRYISLPSYKPHGGDTSGATRRFASNVLLAFF